MKDDKIEAPAPSAHSSSVAASSTPKAASSIVPDDSKKKPFQPTHDDKGSEQVHEQAAEFHASPLAQKHILNDKAKSDSNNDPLSDNKSAKASIKASESDSAHAKAVAPAHDNSANKENQASTKANKPSADSSSSQSNNAKSSSDASQKTDNAPAANTPPAQPKIDPTSGTTLHTDGGFSVQVAGKGTVGISAPNSSNQADVVIGDPHEYSNGKLTNWTTPQELFGLADGTVIQEIAPDAHSLVSTVKVFNSDSTVEHVYDAATGDETQLITDDQQVAADKQATLSTQEPMKYIDKNGNVSSTTPDAYQKLIGNPVTQPNPPDFQCGDGCDCSCGCADSGSQSDNGGTVSGNTGNNSTGNTGGANGSGSTGSAGSGSGSNAGGVNSGGNNVSGNTGSIDNSQITELLSELVQLVMILIQDLEGNNGGLPGGSGPIDFSNVNPFPMNPNDNMTAKSDTQNYNDKLNLVKNAQYGNYAQNGRYYHVYNSAQGDKVVEISDGPTSQAGQGKQVYDLNKQGVITYDSYNRLSHPVPLANASNSNIAFPFPYPNPYHETTIYTPQTINVDGANELQSLKVVTLSNEGSSINSPQTERQRIIVYLDGSTEESYNGGPLTYVPAGPQYPQPIPVTPYLKTNSSSSAANSNAANQSASVVA